MMTTFLFGRHTILLILFSIISTFTYHIHLVTASKAAHVSLHASWNATSPAAEATIHFLQIGGLDTASKFLTGVTGIRSQDTENNGKVLSEEAEEDLIMKASKHVTGDNSLSKATLKWVLSSRIHSPHIHLQYSLSSRARSLFQNHLHEASIFATVTSTSEDDKVSIITDHSDLTVDTLTKSISSIHLLPSLRPHTGDHLPLYVTNVHPKSEPCNPTLFIMLYAHATDEALFDWLRMLATLSTYCQAKTGIRFSAPLIPYKAPRSHPPMQAFLAHVTLKSTEYKVVDDRVFETKLFPDCPQGLSINDHCTSTLKTEEDESKFDWPKIPVNDSDFQFTPLYASMFIKKYAHEQGGSIHNVLESLSLFTEDGPSVTRTVEFKEYSEGTWTKDDENTMMRSVSKFRHSIGDGSFVMLNGFHLDVANLKQGLSPLLSCLSSISTASQFLSTNSDSSFPTLPKATKGSAVKEEKLRVLLPVLRDNGQSTVWLNDIHIDSRYKRWLKLNFSDSSTVTKYIYEVRKHTKRTNNDMPEHLKLVQVRAHVVTLVLILDPGDMEHLAYMSIPETIVRGDIPIRVGLLLIPNSYASELVTATFHHLLRVNGRKTAVQFLSMIGQVIQYFGGGTMAGSGGMLSENVVNVAYQQVASKSKSEYGTPAEILEMDDEVKQILNEAKDVASGLKLFNDIDPEDLKQQEDDDENQEEAVEKKKVTQKVSLLCVMNGIVVKDVARDLIPMAIKEQQRVADMLESGSFEKHVQGIENIKDMNVEKWISADDNLIVVRKLSEDMRSGIGGGSRSPFAARNRGSSNNGKEELRLKGKDVMSVMEAMDKVVYITSMKDKYKVTVWLARGRDGTTDEYERLESIFETAISSEFAQQTMSRFAIVDPSSDLYEVIMKTSFQEIEKDDIIIVINGRIVRGSLIESIDDLFVEVASEFQNVILSDDVKGENRLLFRLYDIEITASCSKDMHEGERLSSQTDIVEAMKASNEISSLSIPSELSDVVTPLDVIAVVDPTDKDAFIISSLLQALQSSFSKNEMTMSVSIVPDLETARTKQEPPKTFYKFLLSPSPSSSKARFPTRLSFTRLPQDLVLTMAIDTPRAWFVSSHSTNYDMDNVILGSISGTSDLFSEFELRNLIVEGSCIDEKDQPPQGLKLVLTNGDGGSKVDTLVMANLGYFQLKVPAPGMWWLKLAKGASNRIFQLKAMEMYDNNGVRSVFKADEDGKVPVPVESLDGAGGIILRVVRRPGMKGKSVLEQSSIMNSDEDSGGEGDDGDFESNGEQKKELNVLGKLKETFGKLMKGNGEENVKKEEEKFLEEKEEEEENVEDDEMIHVFSVASGHLYERFLKIMISSVTKHATRKVKFWLLENYLSPSFKKLIPEFAREHNAEVGTVTYKWPGWLRTQTEKQRIIWAYKILFLDVLFPLNVKRIIFVDSDQVIRGDLSELMDIDLKGAPYGYVPFCDSRKEVEGFRFWKSGFWKETLRGEKYRISALYVVDLKRFRSTAAGDTLRYVYQSLSGDPNSLSNLDQDLPNYASVNAMGGNAVPIFNLPQDWLWCESWCDDDSKSTAKAIDLCNNPMTKEPKLVSAKRIIKEWVEIDNNATDLTEIIYKRLAEGNDECQVNREKQLNDQSCSMCEEKDTTTAVDGDDDDDEEDEFKTEL